MKAIMSMDRRVRNLSPDPPKKALEAMDAIMADEQTVSVPVDENGRDARIEKYIL